MLPAIVCAVFPILTINHISIRETFCIRSKCTSGKFSALLPEGDQTKTWRHGGKIVDDVFPECIFSGCYVSSLYLIYSNFIYGVSGEYC